MKKQLYFLHIPKTAGTATTSALEPLLKERFIDLGHCTCNGVTYPWVRRAYVSSFNPKTDQKPDSLIFTIVRNPYDLLVSLYTYGIPYTAPKHCEIFKQINFPFSSFRDFVTRICDLENYPWYAPLQQESLYFQIFDKDGFAVPHVAIKQECLLDGISRMAKKYFDIEIDNIPKVRQTREKEQSSYLDYYDDELKDMVAKKFEGDLRAFGYACGTHDGNPMIYCDNIKYSWDNHKYDCNLPARIEDKNVKLTGKLSDIDIHQASFLNDVTLGHSATSLSRIVMQRLIQKLSSR